ncbi:uncharacterized protein LOC113518952 [Galleria mellonella]|uniref:Uncharacterized protein LOC113518952 n=1 Tax=Galleria mellonella TaxID=7137 RepID=A0ABM3MAX7_GALME|nr:uncharacterized protein LOC113518952 [Galleria mellonella]
MVNGFTFGKHYKMRTGARWQCTQNQSRACKAYLVLDSENRIIKSNTEHSHDPPTGFIRTDSGKTLLMFNDYTYSMHYRLKSGIRWQCSRHCSKKCNAYVILNEFGVVIKKEVCHTHEPWKYHRDMKYIKTFKGNVLAVYNKFLYFKDFAATRNTMQVYKKNFDEIRLPLELHPDGLQVVQRFPPRHKRYAGGKSENGTYSFTSVLLPGKLFTAEFYLRPNGRINLRLNNFTFYKHLKARSNAHRWSCTAYGSKWKCKAHLILTDKLEVLKANVAHSHPPNKHNLKGKPNFHLPVNNMFNVVKQNGAGLIHDSFDGSYHSPLHDYLVAHSVFRNE